MASGPLTYVTMVVSWTATVFILRFYARLTGLLASQMAQKRPSSASEETMRN
jgi:hypothetical protein